MMFSKNSKYVKNVLNKMHKDDFKMFHRNTLDTKIILKQSTDCSENTIFYFTVRILLQIIAHYVQYRRQIKKKTKKKKQTVDLVRLNVLADFRPMDSHKN